MAAHPVARHGQRGSASIEVLGFLPWLLLILMAGMQLFAVAFAAGSAADAARAGARAASKGRPDAQIVAVRALSPRLRDDASVRVFGTSASVTVRVPLFVPGLSSSRVTLTRSAHMPNPLF
jgi:hypothetical protein